MRFAKREALCMGWTLFCNSSPEMSALSWTMPNHRRPCRPLTQSRCSLIASSFGGCHGRVVGVGIQRQRR